MADDPGSLNNEVIEIGDEEEQEVEEPSQKKRKIHMTDMEIVEYEKTSAGSAALCQPQTVAKSSRDPNKGLYPRNSHRNFATASNSKSNPKNFGLSVGFQKASEVLNPVLPFAPPVKQPKYIVVPSPEKSKDGSGTSTNSRNNLTTKRSVIRSPIKQGKGSILYYSVPVKKLDDNENENDPSTSQSSEASTDNMSPTLSVTKQLFNAQAESLVNRLAKKTTKKGKRKKTPVFNRDNAFLYSGPASAEDPLAMGIKASLADMDSDSDSSDSPLQYFERLPVEIIENIFSRLPILDIYLNLPLVCTDWQDIIQEKQFIPWKKRYFRIKMSATPTETDEYREVIELMQQHDMTSVGSYLTGLITYMGSYKATRCEVTVSLKRHSKFAWAHDLMHERMPHLIKNKELNPWSVVTLLCVLAERVSDVTEVMTCLLSGACSLMAVDIIECLYCIATFLWVFKQLKYRDVWTHMHYRVYYALYLFENESIYSSEQLQSVFKNEKGQQSLVKYSSNREMELTHEQMRIVKFDPREGEFAKIVAFAGTGKTTTLVRYTKLRPNKKFLLIVFNKSVKEYASRTFPPNVSCQTGHGLAFRPVGSRYANVDKNKGRYEKRKFNSYGLKVGGLVQLLQARKGISLFVQAKFVLDTLAKFMSSADELITTAHVPATMMDKEGLIKEIDHAMQMHISEDASGIWERMKDLEDIEVPMTHDGYLKLYQLRKPRLWGYDMILVDEAQDLTPAVYDIIANQKQPKILVGDPHQQIYSFRGAVNAMDLVEATHTFYLTQSFRFGPEIAFVANCALEFFKGETKRTLVGNAKPGSILGDTEGQMAIITRTNFQLFAEAVKKCCYNDRDVKVAFAGGVEGFGFPIIQAIYALMLMPRQRTKEQARELEKNKFISRFDSLMALEKYATQAQDNELLGKIKIVKMYNHTLPSLISGILKKTVNIHTSADIIFSTAHKAKGLEFSTVMLTDDYNAVPSVVYQRAGQTNAAARDEANLLYVAVTRAKKRLILTPALMSLLDMSGENFLHPKFSKDMRPEAEGNDATQNNAGLDTFKCALTARQFKPCVLTLNKRALKLYDGRRDDGGLLCPQVIREECPSLCGLYGNLQDERHNDVSDSQSEGDHVPSAEFRRFLRASANNAGGPMVHVVPLHQMNPVQMNGAAAANNN